MECQKPKLYYRFVDTRVSNGFDEFERDTGYHIQVWVQTFPVLKKTPKGVWLDYCGAKKFVLKKSFKRFACSTLREARKSFEARKRKQIKILSKQLRDAERALSLALDAEHAYKSLHAKN